MAEVGYEYRDTTIENPAYDPREYNTDAVSSNLTTDASFDPGTPQDAELAGRELQITDMEDWLDKALSFDKRSWKRATKEGKRLFAARLTRGLDNNGKPAINFRLSDNNTLPISDANFIGKMMSQDALVKSLGSGNEKLAKQIVKEIKEILTTPDPAPSEQFEMQPVESPVRSQVQEVAAETN